jgi:hypothetical protein
MLKLLSWQFAQELVMVAKIERLKQPCAIALSRLRDGFALVFFLKPDEGEVGVRLELSGGMPYISYEGDFQ